MGRGDPQIDVFVDTVQKIAPDVLLITDIDWDYHNVAVDDLADKIGDFPFRLSLRPNSGMPTGIDLDDDGRLGSPGDAQGFGWFVGQGGMALLSKYPMQLIADHSALLWSEQPDSLLFDGMTQEARNVQRLSSSGHWEVLVSGIYLLAFAAGPPVFDGPEDRNGRRNHDEIAFWRQRLNDDLGPVVVIGNANLDPADGEGRKAAIQTLLAHPRLQDPKPRSSGGELAANPEHKGDPGLDTADWPDPVPGNLRVSYILPDRSLRVLDSGVYWPIGAAAEAMQEHGLRHRLVWVDVKPP